MFGPIRSVFNFRLAFFTAALLGPGAAWAAPAQFTAQSPNGAVAISLSVPEDGPLSYAVSYRGQAVIDSSALGLELEHQPPLKTGFRVVSSRPGQIDETYPVPAGKSNPVHNRCQTLTLDLVETGELGRRLTIEARAYDDGAAFRYLLPAQPMLREARITAEDTDFDLAKEGTAYPLLLNGYRTSYEDDYLMMPLASIRPDYLVGLPLLVELPGRAWVAIAEADIDNYPGMYLVAAGRPHLRRLHGRLSPSVSEPGIAVQAATPVVSPWRVVMVGDQAGRLLESNLLLNLNPPSAIGDVSWIKPGKTAWDWWSGQYAEGVDFKPGMNTATMKHYVDFASAAGLEYLLIDAGWAAGGRGNQFIGCDLTHTNPEIDLPAILSYARSKRVGVWLWAHWSDIESQAEVCFPLFEQWGIAGVKIDFMQRDDQWMVNFYRRILRLAAQHHLMIDYHGAYKPDGINRTWPNLLTRESVMGAEYNKTSARITPEHNVMLAFTRMLAGPMDYTPGGFDNVTREEFVPRPIKPEVMTTRAHALALYVVFESPLQMVSDYPEAYRDQKDFQFIKAVPTTWDETRVLGGHPDDFIAIARRRGRDWFVGAITGRRARKTELSLAFLGPGPYTAEIYSDAPDAAEHPKHTSITTRTVDGSGHLEVAMAPAGGEAVRLHSTSPSTLPAGVRLIENVPYLEPGRKEKLDLYLPPRNPGDPPSPAVVWIHGGGWTGGTKSEARARSVCGTLAAAGYVCASVEYRLGEGAWPTNLYDCKNGVRFLRAHAAEYHVDPARVAVMGGSAGGHLALMVGLTTGEPGLEPTEPYPGFSSAVSAIGDFYGITDLLTLQKPSPTGELTGHLYDGSSIPTVFGATRDTNPALLAAVSPVNHLRANSPPVFIAQGLADPMVDYEQAKELDRALAAKGVPHQLVLLEHVGHTFTLNRWGGKPLPQDVQGMVLAFLRQNLGAPNAAPRLP